MSHSVRVEFSRLCAISLLGLALLTPLGLTVDFCRIQWPFLEETIEVPMWVGSFSSLSGLSTVDFFPVFPRAFSPGVVMAPSHGFRLRWSGRLVTSGSAELDSAQSSHCVCSLRHILAFVRCKLGSPLFPSPVATLLGIFASISLVSLPWTVLSWSPLWSLSSVSDRLVVVPCQLVGLGECSPASPNCLTSHIRKQCSFGFSASLSQ